jgi:hypothetical protein
MVLSWFLLVEGIAFEEERAINDVIEEGLQMVIESHKKTSYVVWS